MDNEFLARIKLVLDKTGVTEGMKTVASDIEGTKVKLPWDMNTQQLTAGAEKLKQLWGLVTPEVHKSVDAMGDFEKALRRAFIVAPVWMATREIMKETINFIKEGIKHILDTETATHNLTASLNVMGESGKIAIAGIVDNMHNLSIETGKSEASLINIFAAVNKILGDTTKSQIVVTEATKLSLETGSDAAKIAESMAFLYKLQGDSLKGVTTDTQKFQEISALLYATQAKTPGGIEKLMVDIKAFQATMNVTDFGLENTIKLFGAFESAGISNSMALRTGLLRILTNLNDTSKMLGITFPETATSAEIFVKVLEKLGIALKIPGQQGNIYNVIKDVFGGAIRGGTNLGSLAKDLERVQEAFSGKGVTERERYLQAKQLEDINDEASHQIDLFITLKKQLGDAFITGILGGKDFASFLREINASAEKAEIIFQGLGTSLKWIGTAIKYAIPMYGFMAMGEDLGKALTKPILDAGKASDDLYKRISMAQKGELTAQETTSVAAEALNSNLIKDVTLRQKIYDSLVQIAAREGQITEEKSKQIIQGEQSLLLYKKQLDEAKKLATEIYNSLIDKQKTLVNHELELLRLRGASEEEITNQKLILESQILGESKSISELKQRLNTEIQITREKMNQVNIGNDSITLYRLAKKEGIETATIVGQFLTGAIDFNILEQMPKALAAFKEFFSARAEALQAAEYLGIPFRGNLGNIGGGRYTGGGAPGGRIPIPEYEGKKGEKNLSELMKRFEINIPTTIKDMKIAINLQLKEKEGKELLLKKWTDSIIDVLRQDPQINKMIDEIIEKY